MSSMRKVEVASIDGTPVKRMFWSIISDYDLKTGLCELIDNALDLWTLSTRKNLLKIEVELDPDQQMISVTDNAGGVRYEDLHYLITPGGSKNDPKDQVIGIFGVGGKRASIALGQHVEIRTRFKSGDTFQVDITKEWQETEDWDMPVYKTFSIDRGTTSVQITRLRKSFNRSDVVEIKDHLSATYARFFQLGSSLVVNKDSLSPIAFNQWAFPPEYLPKHLQTEVTLEGQKVRLELTAGLIRNRDPEIENYGVYFYCNDRLIVKELRTREVGYFVAGEAGVPHPDASLCRVIVSIHGPAQLMPWNSSKSAINYEHALFQVLRPHLINLVSYFSSLSRRLKHDWEGAATRFNRGSLQEIATDMVSEGKKLNLPSLPKVNKKQVEHFKERNKKTLKTKPWTLGLVEAMAGVEIIRRQRFETGNRIALILLDSNFEIALKEFVVHRTDLFPPVQYTDQKIAQLFARRNTVIAEVLQKQIIPSNLIQRANHYYSMRNKLIHERATLGVTDADIENYRSAIEEILRILFELRF